MGFRLSRARRVALTGALVGAVGLGSPAFAGVLGLPIPTPSVPPITSTTNLGGGIAQTTTTLNQLLNGLKNGAAVAGPVVQAKATEASATAIADLKARAEQTAADAAALDPQAAGADLTGVVTDLQNQATGEVAGLLPLALTTGLQVVQNVVTPVCSLTAVPSSLVPGAGANTTRLYTAALPAIQQADAATNQLLRDTYADVYDQTLASVGKIPSAGPVASALLTLLKYNWTTTYTPPDGGAPIVTTTKALMNVPTPIDVDHDGFFDLCGTTSFALAGSGTSISGLKVTQSITKLPLAKPVLPVQISGGLLNVINFGYDTTDSTVPVVFNSAVTLDGSRLTLDNSYAVHRGKDLTVPPVALSDLALPSGLALPTLPPLLTPAPKPVVTHEMCIGSCTTLAIRDRFENVPQRTHVETPLASAGVDVTYSAPQSADSMSHTFAVGTTITLATAAGRDLPDRVNPAPRSFRSCVSLSNGSCVADAAATDKGSVAFTSDVATLVDDNVAINGAPSNTCTVTSLGLGAHLTGTSFAESFTPATTTAGSGRIAVDTAGAPVEGCVGAGSVLGLTGAPNMTFPAGFSASKRVSVYHGTAVLGVLTGTPLTSKSGAVTCPAGTALGYTSLSPLGTFNLQPVLCRLAPVNTAAPVVSGQAFVDAVLTAGNGTWTPGAPNTPTYTKQWNRCDASGSSCTPIPGATGDTYALQYGSYPDEPTDFGHRFTVTVRATNLDGTASATSAPTSVIGLPPAPVNTALPALGGNRKVGVATSTSTGTWANGVSSYAYQWQRCEADGTSCADVPGATSSSYVLQAADRNHAIRVGVTATNHGGPAGPVFSATAFVPPAPVNTVTPGIKNGPADAVGAAVLTGDNLTATNGTWQYATLPFTYQWQRCDAAGDGCTDIAGATSGGYAVSHPADDGSTLRVVVTAHGVNGDTAVASAATGVVVFNDLSARPATAVPDGVVAATVPGPAGTTYVGGSFDTVGKPTGGAAAASTSGAGAVSAAALTDGGAVRATLPDGTGGYYLGGSFTTVKGIECPALAHIAADGSLDQAYCQPGLTGEVRALSQITAASSSRLIAVGGLFSLGGHDNLMFVDPATPATPLFASDGDPNRAVNAISNNNAAGFYIGGDFTAVGTAPAGGLALETVTPATGTATSIGRSVVWEAAVCTGVAGSDGACGNPATSVKTVVWTSIAVLVGGDFDSAYKTSAPATVTTRRNAASFAPGTASTVQGWNPNTNGTVRAIALPPVPTSGLPALGPFTVYLGGDFTTIGAANLGRPYLAEFGIGITGTSAGAGANNNSGPSTSFNPQPNGPVTALAVSGFTGGPTTAPTSTLSVGGRFTTIFGQSRHRLADINGQGAGTATPATLGSWNPNAGQDVLALTRDNANNLAFVGGAFNVVGGTTRTNLAQLDPATGVTSWNPGTDGAVSTLAYSGGTVYAGGSFASAGGAARANLAAIDGTSGAATSWNPGANGTVSAIDQAGGTTYVGGSFSTLGGAPRSNLGAIDATGAATGWTPSVPGAVLALVARPDRVYAGSGFGAIAFDSTSGAATSYDVDTDGAVDAIAVNSAGVYLGGAFTEVGSESRDHVALTDADSGVVATWNPGVDGEVRSVFLFGSQVFVGGSFTHAGGASRANLAALDAGSDTAQGFAPDPDGTVRSITRTGGGSLTIGGEFTTVAGAVSPGVGFFGG